MLIYLNLLKMSRVSAACYRAAAEVGAHADTASERLEEEDHRAVHGPGRDTRGTEPRVEARRDRPHRTGHEGRFTEVTMAVLRRTS